MKWYKILSRDKNQCIYCGDNEPPLFTIALDGSSEPLAENTATICEICKITDARKVLGPTASRAFVLEIKRRNKDWGIDDLEKVENPTYDELVDAGQHRAPLPQRDYFPYEFGDDIRINE